MKQPQGFINPQFPTHVCKLVKSIYGLKQAPRAWNAKFTSYMQAIGFEALVFDSSLFVKTKGAHVVILFLYLDDIIIAGSHSQLIQYVITTLSEVFDLKDMGKLAYFLGLQVTYKPNGICFLIKANMLKT